MIITQLTMQIDLQFTYFERIIYFILIYFEVVAQEHKHATVVGWITIRGNKIFNIFIFSTRNEFGIRRKVAMEWKCAIGRSILTLGFQVLSTFRAMCGIQCE